MDQNPIQGQPQGMTQAQNQGQWRDESGLVGHYPTDPTHALGDITRYFQTGDTKLLAHGVYDLLGFGLFLFMGEPDQLIADPEIVGASVTQLHAAMNENPRALPDWAKPVLKMALSFLMNWLSTRKNNG